MRQANHCQNPNERIRVLRIAHASLTPALRQRERALVRNHPEIDLEVLTARRWREAEVDVSATTDDMFPVAAASTHLSRHIQLFAYDPRPIIAALRRHRPHIIDLGHEPYSVACAEVLLLCTLFAPKATIVMQTAQNINHKYPPPFNWLERRAFRRVAAAYACSETVVEVLRAKGFVKPAPIVPFGVNTEAFHPRAAETRRKDEPLTIGFVGRMLPGKGLNVLADALEKIKSESWKLLIVGDGSERVAFEQRLVGAGLRDRAVFTGSVNFDSVPDYFRKMDMLVLPTQTTKRIREQFGRVLVEAMASGVPVIGSTCGAIPEVIGDAGLVFAEGDSDALAESLRRMLFDNDLRSALAVAGHAQVEQYSWDRIAEKTFELFCQVLPSGKAPNLNRALAPVQLVTLGCAIVSLFELFA
jgi:glycosyltransferase involved in cell wall biosynthesis